MPFGPYADFDACVLDQTKKGADKLSAQKICGSMQSKLGGGQLTSFEEKDGDIYLKYFFADDSIARKVRNPQTGEWEGIETPFDFSISSETINARDREAIKLPFSILPTRDLSIYGDYHPWSPKPNATWEDHVAFARNYSPGEIVEITPHSALQGGAVEDIKSHNGRFAVVHITNPEANAAYKKNPELIPKFVSPGFMNLDAPNAMNIQNLRWTHLAAVPMGAYGQKAGLYGTCIGSEGCINQLVAGAVSNLSERITYCPVGASIMITSLLANNENNNKMDSNTQTQTPATNKPNPDITATPSTPPVNNSAVKPIVRLKTQINNTNPNDPNASNNNALAQGQTPNPEDKSEIENMKAMIQDMQLKQQQVQRREQIKQVIPKELFIMKGKFDEKGYEAEVDKRLQSNWTDAEISEYYSNKLELLKAGYQFPKEENNLGQPQMQGMEATTPNTPMGGGVSAPDLLGGGTEDFVNKQVRQLLTRSMGVNV